MAKPLEEPPIPPSGPPPPVQCKTVAKNIMIFTIFRKRLKFVVKTCVFLHCLAVPHQGIPEFEPFTGGSTRQGTQIPPFAYRKIEPLAGGNTQQGTQRPPFAAREFEQFAGGSTRRSTYTLKPNPVPEAKP